jgi:hypothetical protein
MTITTDHPFTTEAPVEHDLDAPPSPETPTPGRHRLSGRTVLRWGAVLAAVGATAVFVVQVVDGDDQPAPGISDAKDNPGFGPISVGVTADPGVSDAKDNPGFGPITVGVTADPGLSDAKDNPGFGPITVGPTATPDADADADDHPRWAPIQRR